MTKRMMFLLLALLALGLAACQGAGGGAPSANIGGVEWKLAEINGVAAIPGRDVTLKIDGTQAGGNSGCNSYGGSVSVDGAKVSFSQLAMTEMACMDPAGIMDQESAFLQALSQAASFTVSGDRLELQDAQGNTLAAFTK